MRNKIPKSEESSHSTVMKYVSRFPSQNSLTRASFVTDSFLSGCVEYTYILLPSNWDTRPIPYSTNFQTPIYRLFLSPCRGTRRRDFGLVFLTSTYQYNIYKLDCGWIMPRFCYVSPVLTISSLCPNTKASIRLYAIVVAAATKTWPTQLFLL